MLATSLRPDHNDGRKIRVLVADDTPNMLLLLVAILEQDPAVIVAGTAADGAAALAAAAQLRPDLVVLDVSMPVMHGLEAATRLRTRQPSVRILMVSADNDEDLVQACLDAGADAFLFKGDFRAQLPACLASLFPPAQATAADAVPQCI
jgi:DNA-binding NarL/FixJ family response regulator